MRNIFAITLLALALNAAYGADYCSLDCRGTQNIGCNNNGAWGSACPGDQEMVTLSDADKAAIVNRHNDHRNFIAGGGDSKLSAACRMGSIRWNEDLAYLASFQVKSCEMKHDACRRTEAFTYAGQNLAWMGYFDPLNTNSLVVQGADLWYAEVKDTLQSQIDAYPANYSKPVIGHFTVMVADRNTDVGCAASIYSVEGKTYKAFLLACNYATTNMIGAKMYASCPTPATGCTTGTNPSYSNLCSSSESIDANKF